MVDGVLSVSEIPEKTHETTNEFEFLILTGTACLEGIG